ncbi:hypothetical protein HPP92_020465 [Vanilla planifolia]|uniref:Target of Myb protein 1 n=1 Tax=Vanilla planifolia TaxID=51239 RepID=A0A835PY50_VANPL|nr:hypothetical protein HPP92_020465 [Vanilla planifolia]
MEKIKLGSLGERLKTRGERLKVGGAELGRKFSGKMKEILQGQSQEAKMVEEATSESLEEANWGLNLRICNLLNNEEFDGSEVVRTIKKKIASKSLVSQRLSLDLLEMCAMNCEKVFSEVASEKVLEELVKMIDNPQTQHATRQRALQLIEAWGKSDDLSYLPVFRQTYNNLKSRFMHTEQDDGSSAQLLYSLEDFDDEHAFLAEGYPIHSSDQQPTVEGSFSFEEMTLSMEEKKEMLAITRNSLEILSSLLNTNICKERNKESVKDELLNTMVDKCRESQPVLQRIIETTSGDESVLFEALSLHDELEQVLADYSKLEVPQTPADEQFHGELVASEEQNCIPPGEKEDEGKIRDAKEREAADDSRTTEKKG